jgi:hypothetical protein
VKEEVLGLIPTRDEWLCDGNRWYIMSSVPSPYSWSGTKVPNKLLFLRKVNQKY